MADSIGALLRETREARGQTLADVERATRIRVKYLAAIEADEFSVIPSATQARGFLHNYARHLGLDADEVLAQFEAPARRSTLGDLARSLTRRGSRAPRPAAPPPAPPAPGDTRPSPAVTQPARPRRAWALGARRFRWLSADVVVGGVIVVALLGFFVWGSSRLAGVLFQATPEATVIELGRPNQTASATSAPPQETAPPVTQLPTAPPQLPALTNVPVSLQFEQTAWVQVLVDGTEAFRGMVQPGNKQDYLGQSSVEVFTGNGAGVRVNYGGIDYGPLGGFGEVVYRIYTTGGVLTPTASPSPEVTDTSTPRPDTETPTPRPTPSPQGSVTPGTPTQVPTVTVRPSETVPPSPTSGS